MPFLQGIGPFEIIIILVIVLIVFCVGKLPQIGGAIGKSIKEFHKAREGDDEEKSKEKTTVTPSETETKDKT
jgi:sec-independent protein translocase protein TatA